MNNLSRRDFGKWMGSLWAAAMAPISAVNAVLPSVATKTFTDPKILSVNVHCCIDFDGLFQFPTSLELYDDDCIQNQKVEVSVDYLSEDGEYFYTLEFARTLCENICVLSHKKLDSHVSQSSVVVYDILGNQVSFEKLTIGDRYDLDVIVPDYENSSSLLIIKDMELVKITVKSTEEEEEEEEEEQEDDEYYNDYDRDYNEY